jgi:hypothetical protein
MTFRVPCRLLALLALLGVPAAPARGQDEGQKIYESTCTKCHDAKNHPLDGVRLTREKWKEQIERMEGLGAEIPSGKKLDTLLDWLVKTHGPDVPVTGGKPAADGK